MLIKTAWFFQFKNIQQCLSPFTFLFVAFVKHNIDSMIDLALGVDINGRNTLITICSVITALSLLSGCMGFHYYRGILITTINALTRFIYVMLITI